MISKKEIEEATEKFAENKSSAEVFRNTHMRDFKSGIAFAESKLKDIAIEFGRFAYDHYEDSYLSFEELFELFLKKRNEK